MLSKYGVNSRAILDLAVRDKRVEVLVIIRCLLKHRENIHVMNLNQTVNHLKNKISGKEGIPTSLFEVSYKGEVLEESTMMSAIESSNGNLLLDLELHQGQFQISVLPTFTKKPFSLCVEINMSVSQLKEQIFEQTGVQVDLLELYLHGEFLEDEAMIKDLNLQKGDSVNLKINSTQVIVDILKEEKVYVDYDFFDTVEMLKQKVFKATGIPVESQTLIFKDQVLGKSKSMGYYNIYPGSTISSIKKSLPEFNFGESSKTIASLTFQGSTKSVNTDHLDNHDFDFDEDITKKEERMSEEMLSLSEVPLHMESDQSCNISEEGTTQSCFDFKSVDGIPLSEEIIMRKNLEEKEQIQKFFDLAFRTKDTVPEENREKIITERDHISKETTHKEEAQSTDSKIKEIIRNLDTIKLDNKELSPICIQQEDYPTEQIEPKEKEIIENEKEAETECTFEFVELNHYYHSHNDSKTINELNQAFLKDEESSVCDLTCSNSPKVEKLEFYIKFSLGKLIRIKAKPSDTIRKIKKKIEPKVRAPPLRQIFMFRGVELPNYFTVSQSKIAYGEHISYEEDRTGLPKNVKSCCTIF